MTATIQIRTDADRQIVQRWAHVAPLGTVFTAKRRKRSLPSNARMWVMLTAVSEQVVWHSRKWPAEAWKDFFSFALQVETYMPGMHGAPIPLGMRTSEMDQDTHTDLMALIEAFGASHGVDFGEPAQPETQAA